MILYSIRKLIRHKLTRMAHCKSFYDELSKELLQVQTVIPNGTFPSCSLVSRLSSVQNELGVVLELEYVSTSGHRQ